MAGEMRKKVGVVIPVFNEQSNVDTLCDRLAAVMAGLPEVDWRLVFVDDGSRDETVARLAARRDAGLPITVLRFSRNFGHQAAIKAGLDFVDADAVVTMDGDLQHPPELIGRFVELWRAGYDVVQTVRRPATAGPSGLRPLLVRWAYHVINAFAERPIPPECADFRLIDRKVLAELKKLPEVNPMLRGLVAWVGFRQTTLEYEVQPRHGGVSRFTFRQLLNLLLGGVFDLSRRPLAFGTAAGLALMAMGFLAWLAGLIGGMVFLALFLAAVELLGLGLIGAYLGRAYEQVLDRPVYIVSERVNCREQVPPWR